MNVAISSRTPQQALAALLDRYAPARLLLIGASEFPALTAFKEAFKGLVDVDYVAELKNIKTPVLILWGDADGFFKAEGQSILRKHLRHAKHITYKGTGHAIHWEEPVKFTRDIVAFVNSIPK
mgnify:CR=1 FL=1